MGRPRKKRYLGFLPRNIRFLPQLEPEKGTEEVVLTFEELEALRLADLYGKEQQEGADMMNISRGTFQRILSSAHHKVADALVSGKPLFIDGGDFDLRKCEFTCSECGEHWEANCQQTPQGKTIQCPKCDSILIECNNQFGDCMVGNIGEQGMRKRRNRCGKHRNGRNQ